MANKWTSDEVWQLNDFANKGLTVNQIAILMGKSPNAVSTKLHRMNENSESFDLISLTEIADQIGAYRNNIMIYLQRDGVESTLINKKRYYKLSDIHTWLCNGFALSCVLNCKPKDNDIWGYIKSIVSSGMPWITTRQKVCDAFGVNNSTIGYWIDRFGFPKPIQRIHSAGHIYLVKDVTEWARANNKTHGSLKINVEDYIQKISNVGD